MNLTCPNCAADLDLPEDRDVAFCSYCGKKILIGEHTYVALAERYGKRGNKKELNLYLDKALEDDISVGDNVDALLAKAKYKKLKHKEDKEEKKEDDEWKSCCGCIITAIVIFCVTGSCCG